MLEIASLERIFLPCVSHVWRKILIDQIKLTIGESGPGWPGAHSQGETLDELEKNLHEVIEMLLQDSDPNSNPSSSGFG